MIFVLDARICLQFAEEEEALFNVGYVYNKKTLGWDITHWLAYQTMDLEVLSSNPPQVGIYLHRSYISDVMGCNGFNPML